MIGKVSWYDRNGMHFGMTSRQESIPVGMAATEKVSIQFDSFPVGGSDMESRYPNMTRSMY